MSTEDQKAREAFEAYMISRNACTRLHRQRESLGGFYRTTTVQRAWELWQAALMSNAAPEVDRSAERVEAALCIKPACPTTCSGCNHAISGQDARDYAIRYAWLRDRANFVREDAPQVVITDWSGSIISIQPWAYPQGAALDEAIDAFIRALAAPLQGKETP